MQPLRWGTRSRHLHRAPASASRTPGSDPPRRARSARRRGGPADPGAAQSGSCTGAGCRPAARRRPAGAGCGPAVRRRPAGAGCRPAARPLSRRRSPGLAAAPCALGTGTVDRLPRPGATTGPRPATGDCRTCDRGDRAESPASANRVGSEAGAALTSGLSGAGRRIAPGVAAPAASTARMGPAGAGLEPGGRAEGGWLPWRPGPVGRRSAPAHQSGDGVGHPGKLFLAITRLLVPISAVGACRRGLFHSGESPGPCRRHGWRRPGQPAGSHMVSDHRGGLRCAGSVDDGEGKPSLSGPLS